MEIPSFPQRPGSQKLPLNRVYGIRKKYIRIGNKFDLVEGVGFQQSYQTTFYIV